jgi:hypothetical protein
MKFFRYSGNFVMLREEHRPRVFQNRVQRCIFESKSDEVTGDWRQLQMRTFICEISGCHGVEYEDERSILEYSALQSRWSRPKFQRCVLPS